MIKDARKLVKLFQYRSFAHLTINLLSSSKLLFIFPI